MGGGEVSASERGWETDFYSDGEQLFGPTEVKIKRHVKVIDTKNSHMDAEYFQQKQKKRKQGCGHVDKGFAM